MTKKDLLHHALRWTNLKLQRPDLCKAYWADPCPAAARSIVEAYLRSDEARSSILRHLPKELENYLREEKLLTNDNDGLKLNAWRMGADKEEG